MNISSSGLLLRTENVLLPGKTVEVAVSWAEKLNGNCSLKLVTRGRVVRCGRGVAAIMIKGYEFRTDWQAERWGRPFALTVKEGRPRVRRLVPPGNLYQLFFLSDLMHRLGQIP